ncbi:MAG: GAF domain-containing sensor histidine kinase [Deltaproteobacteria bacterium]|nr:GAF domain-containing sensor histidine kinase [Deltaproteobacteria bacterium]
MIVIYLAESSGRLRSHPLCFGETPFATTQLPVQAALILIFFAASIYFTVFFTSSIVFTIRQRISRLVELTEAVRRLNERLNSLYSMTEAIGSVKNLKTVFKMVTSELCQVMGVLGISVKLLSEDGKLLQYVAADGLVADVFKSKVIEVAKSPLNREIINGKPFVTGHIKPGEMMFQFGEDLAAANIQSVLFVPLVVKNRVIGIVGAYCKDEERFSPEEVDFFRRAAGLVAVAIENARSYEAIEKLMSERSRFMMRVSHNLRSPLAAMISMLDVVRGGYQGELNADQSEYLRRVDRRARTMIRMINELLTLSKSRDEHLEHAFQPLDLLVIAGRIQRTFQDEARQKGLRFEIIAPKSLPLILGNTDMIEQVLENLVSNAVKYTESGGSVKVEFLEGPKQTVQALISDTGIGISEDDRKNLFTEFFRAENAGAMEEIGTGLGLAIVKQTVDQHGGRIIVESTLGQGTLFVVSFPVATKGCDT